MIHRYTLNGMNIVIDTHSGSVHVVDPVAYDVIGLYDQGKGREEILSAMLEKYARDPRVTREELEASAMAYGKSPYGAHLRKVADGKYIY